MRPSSSPATPTPTRRAAARGRRRGRIAGENAARYPDVPRFARAPLAVVFSDPQIALAGQGHARLVPGTFVTGQVDFGDQAARG